LFVSRLCSHSLLPHALAAPKIPRKLLRRFRLVGPLHTDHISVLGDPTAAGFTLLSRLDESGEDVATAVITVEENLQGWLAQVRAAKTPEAEIGAYGRFQRRVDFFADWVILP